MESENPDDRQRIAAAEEQKKRKRSESNKKYYQKIKKESKQAQLKTVQNECSRCKAQLESYEKSVMKPLLDAACKFRKLVLEPGESSGHAIEAVEKQTDLVNSLSWELLKTPLPGGGTCGGTSASTDKEAYPPLELSVAAMKPDGSVTTESFKPCQLLPEQWTPLTFNELKELYIASEAQHAQEKVTLLKLHAQEMAATEDHHAQEMAATVARHAQEMAAAAALHAREMDAAVALHAREMDAAVARHAREMAAAAALHAREMDAVKTEYSLELEILKEELKWAQDRPYSNLFEDKEPPTL